MELCERLHAFLRSQESDIYEEPPGEPNLSITRTVIHSLDQSGFLAKGARILDVGCGQGWALKLFGKLGYQAVGITLGPDYDVCKAAGYDVRPMNLHDIDFPDARFDLVWCRHALEHSIFPLFTLHEMKRVAVPGGLIYVEVPAPNTACHHEKNPNHYSMFEKIVWHELFKKANLDLFKTLDLKVVVPDGPDLYWAFFLRTPS